MAALLAGGGAAIWAATARHQAALPGASATSPANGTPPAAPAQPPPVKAPAKAPATPPTQAAPATPTARRHPRHLRRHRAAARAPAVLQINAYPYANVRLDGRRALGTTPLRAVQVPPGRHVLELTNPELKLKRTVHLELEPGEHKTVGVRLDR